MLRILLVDDEKEILDWLRELFTEQQRVPWRCTRPAPAAPP
jgi:CheY-like chemotaxis protein